MKRLLISTVLLILFWQCSGKDMHSSVCDEKDSTVINHGETEIVEQEKDSKQIPHGVAVLIKVYPEQIISFEDGYLLMTNGESVVYDDCKEKDYLTMLDKSDPEDMFKLKYDRNATIPKDIMSDAGRSRCEQLFKAMYGHSSSEVQKNLVKVSWFGQQIPFTKVNGAADSLKAVAHELEKYPEYIKYLKQSSSFYWRLVRGAKRQSAHSYGIAIDINTSYSNYWLWSNPNSKELDAIKYENRIPEEIIRIFENHGFIWGGRWYHYDTMHFEFRPEFLTSQ